MVGSAWIAGAVGNPPWTERIARLDSLAVHREYAAATTLGRDLLADLEAAGRADSSEAAEVIDLLVRALRSAGQSRSPETLALAERGLELRTSRYGPASPEAARAMITVADVLTDLRQLDRARTLLDGALAILAAASPPDDLAIADARRAIGNLQLAGGDPAGARDSYRQTLEAVESLRGSDAPEAIDLLGVLAMLTRRAGELDEALDLGRLALARAERVFGPAHEMVARILNIQAISLREAGDLAGARRDLERALAIWEAEYGADDLRVAGLLNNLGNLTRQAGDLRSARSFLERSLAIRERTRGPDHPEVAQSLNNLALVAQEAGDLESARRYLERALAIRERTLGPEHPDVAVVLINMAEVENLLGQLEEARRHDERALEIRRTALGPEHPLVAETLHNLAIIHAELDEVEAGRAMALQALEIWQRTYGPDHPRTAIATLTLARMDVLAGRFGEALDGALRAEDLARDVLWFNAKQLAEREALQLVETQTSGRHLAMTLLAAGESTPAARRRVWEAVARSRALVLAAAIARRHLAADAGASVAVRSAADRLETSRDELADALVRAWSDPGPARQEEVAAARAKVAADERALAAASPSFGHQVAAAALTAEEVGAALPPATALVSIVRYRSDSVLDHRRRLETGATRREGPEVDMIPSYLAFVLRAGGEAPSVVPLGPAAEIERVVERWAREAAHGPMVAGRSTDAAMAAYRVEGEALRRRIWDPIAARVGDARLVLMVCDGALHRVSWASLPAGPGRYLADAGPVVHRLAAERDVLELQLAHDHGRGLLALGDARYDAMPAKGDRTGDDSTALRGVGGLCASLRGRTFRPLPASATEIADVAAIWRRDVSGSEADPGSDDVVLLTGDGASEPALRRATGGRRVIHLATHGFTLTGDCEPAAAPGLRGIGGLVAAASSSSSAVTPQAVEDLGSDLGVLTGLAVAGANHRELAGDLGSDGILTAEEIANLDLEGVEWVVLSACDTAGGEVRPGEGVIGLSRAFRVAGAHAVIMSLWEVEDDSARAFMEALYDARFGAGLATPEAMDAAARSVLESRRRRGLSTHPFHWAGFVATGDWS